MSFCLLFFNQETYRFESSYGQPFLICQKAITSAELKTPDLESASTFVMDLGFHIGSWLLWEINRSCKTESCLQKTLYQ